MLPSLAESIYSSFCKAENEISNVVNYRISEGTGNYMDHILELGQVTKTYQRSGFELENVSFSVPYGSIMGFVGRMARGRLQQLVVFSTRLGKTEGTLNCLADKCKIRTRI